MIKTTLTSNAVAWGFTDFCCQNPVWPVVISFGLAGDRQDAAALAVWNDDVAALATNEIARSDLVLLVALKEKQNLLVLDYFHLKRFGSFPLYYFVKQKARKHIYNIMF